MADINNQLDKTEKELKDVEQQAIKTESAVKKVTEAEQEAMMRAALAAAQAQVKSVASKEQSTSLYETVKKLADIDKIKEHGTEKYFNNFLKSIKTNELAQNKLNSNPESFIESLSSLFNTESKNFTVPSLVKILNDSGLDTNIEKLNKINELQKEILERANKLGVSGNAFIGENQFNNTATNINILTKYIETLKMLEDELNKVKDVSLRNKIKLTYQDLSYMADGHSKVPMGKYLYDGINDYFNNNNLYDALIKSGKSSEQAYKIIEKFDSMSKEIQARLNNIGTDKITEKVPEQVKSISDEVVKAVETATNAVKENVNNTVQYVNNAVNGFTLVGGIAEQVKKQFALVPVGKPYVKGNNFNMYEPDAKQLPAVINNTTTALSTEFNNDAIERTKLFYEYLKRIAILKQRMNSAKLDSGISAPEGAFSDSINKLANNAEKEHQEQVKNTAKTYEELRTRVSEVTSSIKHAIANVIGVIRTANNILHKIGITIISVFNGAIRTVQRIIQLFGNLANRIGLANKHTNILRGSFTELKSAIDLLSGAFNKIFNNQFIEQGRKLLGSIQSLKMILGTDLTNSTIEWANKMEDAFGLSAEELISNLREVAAVMYGLGMSTKDVQVGARNLETVGMVLSSISGLGFEEVMTKIQSGMKGMTQSIDDLGLSVRESQMDAYLKKLKSQGGEFANISTSFSSLNEQQRVYVRYAALMDQFTSKEAYTMEKYAESLRSTTGSLSVLNSQLNGLKSAIGTLAMGLFSKVLQPLIYVVYYIKQLIIQLGSFLGIKMKLDAEMNGGGEINTTPIENETDALDEMTDAANKAKGALDELDHISTMSSSSGKSSNTGNSDFDYSSLMSNYDFADALAEYDSNFIEECRQSFHNMLSDIGNDIEKFIKKYSGRIIDWDEVKKNLSVVKESLGGVFTNLVSIAKTAFGTIAGLAYSVFDDLEFTSLTAKFSEALLSFTTFIDTAFKRIQPYVQLFYDRYLSEHVKKFGKYLSDTLDNIKAKFDGLTEEWNNMDDSTLVKKTDELGEKFNNMLTTLKEIGIIFKTLAGLDTNEDNQFMNENASDNMKKAQGIAKTTNSILKETLDIIYQVLHGLADLNDDGVVDSKDLGVAFDFIKEKLDMISTWLKENKDEISKILQNVAETAFKLAETKFDLIMGILNWITDNADLVNGFLDAIKEILELVKEHPMLTLGLIVGGSLSGKGLAGGVAGAAAGAAGAAGNSGKGGIRDIVNSALTMYFGGVVGKNVGKSVYEETAGKEMGAQKGKSLGIAAAAWLTKHPVIAWIELINAEVADLAGQISKMPEAIKESKKDIEAINRGKKGDFGKVFQNYSNIAGYGNITKSQIDSWAFQLRSAAEEVYGKNVSKEQSEKALAIFRNHIAAQGQITKEQLDNLMEELRRTYDEIGKIGPDDKVLYAPTSDSQWDKMANNMDALHYWIEESEKFGNSIEDINAATESLFNQKYNFSDYIKNFFGKTDELFDTPTTFTDRIISNFKLMTETIKTSCEATKLDLGGLIDKFKNIGNNNNPINNMFNENTDINTLSKQADIIKAKFENMGTTIKSSCDTAKSGISGLIDKLKELLNSTDFGKTANSIINLGSSLMTGKKTKEVKKLLGFANGGLPSSGSLFMANENGNTELVGNFGGYAGVANQGMIISAMESAVYNAVTQALKTNTGNGGNTTIEVCKGGVFVGDEAGIRKLANQLNNVNSTGRTNIANVGFSMT